LFGLLFFNGGVVFLFQAYQAQIQEKCRNKGRKHNEDRIKMREKLHQIAAHKIMKHKQEGKNAHDKGHICRKTRGLKLNLQLDYIFIRNEKNSLALTSNYKAITITTQRTSARKREINSLSKVCITAHITAHITAYAASG